MELIFKNGRLQYESDGHDVLWQKIQSDGIKKKYYKKIPIENTIYKYQYNFYEKLFNDYFFDKREICTGKMALSTQKNISKIIF